jgi:hypothetical protein
MLLPLPVWAQTQTYTIPAPHLNLEDAETPEPTYCRPPQPRTDSRLAGPKVCMTVRKWNDLHASGRDIAADGISIVPLQKDLDLLKH